MIGQYIWKMYNFCQFWSLLCIDVKTDLKFESYTSMLTSTQFCRCTCMHTGNCYTVLTHMLSYKLLSFKYCICALAGNTVHSHAWALAGSTRTVQSPRMCTRGIRLTRIVLTYALAYIDILRCGSRNNQSLKRPKFKRFSYIIGDRYYEKLHNQKGSGALVQSICWNLSKIV